MVRFHQRPLSMSLRIEAQNINKTYSGNYISQEAGQHPRQIHQHLIYCYPDDSCSVIKALPENADKLTPQEIIEFMKDGENILVTIKDGEVTPFEMLVGTEKPAGLVLRFVHVKDQK